MAGGKSRKSGQVSKKLIEKIQGKSCGRGSSNTGVTKGGLLNKGGKWFDDFPGDEERKRREAEGEG
jgi:hypothetical protein